MKTISIKLLDYCHYIFFVIFTVIGIYLEILDLILTRPSQGKVVYTG